MYIVWITGRQSATHSVTRLTEVRCSNSRQIQQNREPVFGRWNAPTGRFVMFCTRASQFNKILGLSMGSDVD
jgi:hypothetical protein